MKRIIYKQRLEHAGPTTISESYCTAINILHLDVQNNQPTVWYEVTKADHPVTTIVQIYFADTGEELPEWAETFVGTLILENGNLVKHGYIVNQRVKKYGQQTIAKI